MRYKLIERRNLGDLDYIDISEDENPLTDKVIGEPIKRNSSGDITETDSQFRRRAEQELVRFLRGLQRKQRELKTKDNE